MKILDLFKKKKKKPETKHESPEALEAKKWQAILANVIVYDGTERGQKPVE